MPNCPSCGDQLKDAGPHVRSLACPSCGQWVFISNGSWMDGGRFEHALDAPPLLGVGLELTIEDRRFAVAGRVRLGDGDGHWDEWWLSETAAGGAGVWLEEDNGRYLHHRELKLTLPVDAQHKLGVGMTFDAHGTRWFVTEAFTARVLGAEGQLPLAFDTRESVRCIDAVADGRKLSLELWPEVTSASIAIPIKAVDLLHP